MTQSQGQQDAAKIQRELTDESSQLFNIGSPGLKLALGDLIGDLGKPGSEPASVKQAFGTIRQEQEGQFQQAEASAPASVEQVAKSTGYRGAQGAVGDQTQQTLIGLEQRRRQAARSLQEQESDAALQTRDYDISQILGLGSGGVSQSFGFGQNAISAAGMNTRDPAGGALQGGLAGAGAGATFGPWGALIGGVVGAGAGYFSGSQ